MARELVLLPKSKYDALLNEKENEFANEDIGNDVHGNMKQIVKENNENNTIVESNDKILDEKMKKSNRNHGKGENIHESNAKMENTQGNKPGILKENLPQINNSQETRKSKRVKKPKKMYGGQLFVEYSYLYYVSSSINFKISWIFCIYDARYGLLQCFSKSGL